MVVVLMQLHHCRFKWRSLDPHYDYGNQSDKQPTEDSQAPDNNKGETAAESSHADDPKPKRWLLRLSYITPDSDGT